jgi:UDP-N-acetylmuramoyl-tripeptide--D-alanyl-D-alanine ligase
VLSLTLAEVASLVGGTLSNIDRPDRHVTGEVVIDSRLVRPGALFVAVSGEQVDGHDYADAAVRAGAVGVLAQRPVGAPAVIVENTVVALGRLARSVLDRIAQLTVVGLTGSSGKTSTKDLLAQVLPALGPTVAPVGSFNNEIGLPLTALRCDAETRYLVAEMGARGPGHIAALCAVSPPTIGLVLNVGAAHLGEFGSRELVAAAKGELVEALPPDGIAVLNGDDPFVAGMASRTIARVTTFGSGPGADVRAADVAVDDAARPSFLLLTPEGSAQVRLRGHGGHHVVNALGTAAVARAAGLDVAQIAARLSAAIPQSRWRMEVVDRPDGVTVINDAYNANPDSVSAALTALVTIGKGRRTWAVLGEMRELGEASDEEHDAVGRLAVRLGVDRVVAVGAGARALHRGATEEGAWADAPLFVHDVDHALTALRSDLQAGDVVLVKASRAAGLERVALSLLEEPACGE